MVKLEEAMYWQDASRSWWVLANYPFCKITKREYKKRMDRCKKASSKARKYMGITDQDQLYA